MSRRKHLAIRKPSGGIRHVKSELLSPTETRRLMEGASTGLRDAAWGSMLGRIYLTGKISASEFAAGKRWNELAVEYSQACQSPHQPRTAALETHGGTPADPESATGARQARRHHRATAAWLDGRNALRVVGSTAERVVNAVCAEGQAPAGLSELESLQEGLRALSALWSAKRKAR